MQNVLFLSECNADTALVRFLLPDQIQVDHVQGIHNISGQMITTQANQPDFRVIGIVDKDKHNVPTYFDQFKIINSWERISVKRHFIRDHHLIILEKAIETFILWNAEQVDVQVSDYGFNPIFKQFCKEMKPDSLLVNLNYRRLLGDLFSRQAPGFVTLHHLLNEFIVR